LLVHYNRRSLFLLYRAKLGSRATFTTSNISSFILTLTFNKTAKGEKDYCFFAYNYRVDFAMGVNLTPIVVKETIHLENLRGKSLAVDLLHFSKRKMR